MLRPSIHTGPLFNGVVLDLASYPEKSFAPIIGGELLPVRFALRAEAIKHVRDLVGPLPLTEEAA